MNNEEIVVNVKGDKIFQVLQEAYLLHKATGKQIVIYYTPPLKMKLKILFETLKDYVVSVILWLKRKTQHL